MPLIQWIVQTDLKTGKQIWPIFADYKGRKLEITMAFDMGFSTNGLQHGPEYFAASVLERKPNTDDKLFEYQKWKTIKSFDCKTLEVAKKKLIEYTHMRKMNR